MQKSLTALVAILMAGMVSAGNIESVISVPADASVAVCSEVTQSATASNIINKIPSFAEIYNQLFNHDSLVSLFTNRGFEVSAPTYTYTITEEEAGPEEPGTYVGYKPVVAKLNVGGEPSCVFEQIIEHGWGFKITINGAPEVLAAMKKAADAKFHEEMEQFTQYGFELDELMEYSRCSLNGNTLEIFIDQMGD